MSLPSYNIFDYNYRPSKAVERKLFVELLKEIYGASNENNCAYIGLGAIFFTDFKLIHKELNLKKMINIESKVLDEDRFKFNKPYSCIELKWGYTYDVLPTLNLEDPSILWLDYDQSIQEYMFDDLEIIFNELGAGSFYFISCNSSLQRYFNSSTNSYDDSRFLNDFSSYVPFSFTNTDMERKRSPFLLGRMIKEKIDDILKSRNAALSNDDKLVFHQLLFIKYQDGAPMFSFGGYLDKKEGQKKFKKQPLYKLPYIRTDLKEIFNIESPILTSQEVTLLNKHLPKSKKRFLNYKKIGFIPKEEKEKYLSLYRFHPSFREVREY